VTKASDSESIMFRFWKCWTVMVRCSMKKI
jgi:hypothetical protein